MEEQQTETNPSLEKGREMAKEEGMGETNVSTFNHPHNAPLLSGISPDHSNENLNAITIQEAEENQLALSLSTSMVLRKRDSSELTKKTKIAAMEPQLWFPMLDGIGKFCLGLFSKAEEVGLTMPPTPK